MGVNEKYGLVLGGGGAKGAYEIGVWKALKEMNINVSTVVGASVGALNAAIMVQDDFELACKLWEELNMSTVLRFGEDISISKDDLSLSSIIGAIKYSIINKGMDVTPLKELVNGVIDEEKIRNSDMDLGIITFSVTDFKPVKVFKKDIPKGKLVEYLLASSCFPTFSPQIIDDKRYIDGGVYDNIPVSMLIGKCNNIIVTDVSGPGFKRKVDTSGLNIVTIKNSESLGGTLNFDGKSSKVNIELGYLDTLRAFNKTRGKIYYIDGVREKQNYYDILNKDIMNSIYNFYGFKKNQRNSKLAASIRFRLLRKLMQYISGELNFENSLIALTEICAECLGINRIRLISLNQLIDDIYKEYNLACDSVVKLTTINKSLIFYENNLFQQEGDIISKRRLMAISDPKSALANLFLSILITKKNIYNI